MKTFIILSIMQIAFIQAFAQDHGHDRNRNNYSYNRGHNEHERNFGHNFYNRDNEHRRDIVIRHDAPFRHYDNHLIFHHDYAYHNVYRPEFHFGYPLYYHSAYLPLINFSFGTTYQYGYAYQSDFDRVLIAINSQPYDDSKFTVAKQALQNRSLTSNEVLTIMKSFEYDNTRVSFAELAYDHVVDPQNFYTVNQAFAYSSSVDELNNYLESNYGTR